MVVAAGALNTPQLLIRSGLPEASGDSPSSEWIGRNLGLHPAAFVFGLFDEVQDAHRVYPITSHCMDFMRDEDGGFVLEASTIQDPIGFATSISDEDGPMWGERLVEAVAPVPQLERDPRSSPTTRTTAAWSSARTARRASRPTSIRSSSSG